MTYTKDELKKAISEKESQIRNLKLDQKEEELKVKNTQKSLDSQTVKATISGVGKRKGLEMQKTRPTTEAPLSRSVETKVCTCAAT